MGVIEDKFNSAILKSKYILLSEYSGVYHKVDLCCPKGHMYKVVPKNFANGSRCPICSNRSNEYTKSVFLDLILEHGYTNESEYISTNKNIILKCPNEHLWETIPKKFKNGQRCPKCQNLCPEQAKNKFIEVLAKEGYRLLTKYKNTKVKVTVECPKGHKYTVLPNNFTYHFSRCPHCKGSTGQRKLQELLGDKVEANAIYNDRTVLDGLELDIYFPELKVAIEYQGNYWHNLEIVKERDERKKRLCEEQGIKLIVVWDEDFIDNETDTVNSIIKKMI